MKTNYKLDINIGSLISILNLKHSKLPKILFSNITGLFNSHYLQHK